MFKTHPMRKRFGQHFLRDQGIIEHMVAQINPAFNERLVEIGPGGGALTKPLLQRGALLDVFEIDRDLANRLQITAAFAKGRLQVHCADILLREWVVDCALEADQQVRVIGNLPYYITTPLLFYLLRSRCHIKSMYFMLQREVADRLAAPVATAEYGRLSVMMQYYCDIRTVLQVDAQAFYPVPKVDSSVVQLIPRPQRATLHAENEIAFAQLVATAFSKRRKTIANALRSRCSAAQLALAGIEPRRRPQELQVVEFVRLSNVSQISQ